MKGFLNFLGSVLVIFGAVIGALTVFDKLANKNRIKGDYLECDVDGENDSEDLSE